MRVKKFFRRLFRRLVRSFRRLFRTMRAHVWPTVFGFVLIGYSVFTLLEAFVIPHNVIAMESADDVEIEKEEPVTIHPLTEEEEAAAVEEKASVKPQITRTSYVTPDVDIEISEFRAYDTDIYAADVIVQDPESLRAGLADGEFGRNVNQTTSEIAEENDAILAINGDFYGHRNDGFVLRNGYLYRSDKRADDDSEDLVIYQDGSMEVVKEKITDIQTLINNGATQIFSFGPGLITNGEISVDENTEVEQAMNSNPRTAIGYVPPKEIEKTESDEKEKSDEEESDTEESDEEESDEESDEEESGDEESEDGEAEDEESEDEESEEGESKGEESEKEAEEEEEVEYEECTHYVFLVSDGRSSESTGLTLYELAEVMQSLGCTVAYNMDGGGSTTMYFNGQVVNNPTSGMTKGERGVSDIVFIEK